MHSDKSYIVFADIQEHYEIALLNGSKVNNLFNTSCKISPNLLKLCREGRSISVCNVANNNKDVSIWLLVSFIQTFFIYKTRKEDTKMCTNFTLLWRLTEQQHGCIRLLECDTRDSAAWKSILWQRLNPNFYRLKQLIKINLEIQNNTAKNGILHNYI